MRCHVLVGLAILLLAAAASASPKPDTISGYWGSSKGGMDPPAQLFACINGISKTVVSCTGINVMPDEQYPGVIAAGYRTTYKGTTYSLYFSGQYGGNFTLKAYKSDMMVAFATDAAVPTEMPADLTDLFVWKRIK